MPQREWTFVYEYGTPADRGQQKVQDNRKAKRDALAKPYQSRVPSRRKKPVGPEWISYPANFKRIAREEKPSKVPKRGRGRPRLSRRHWTYKKEFECRSCGRGFCDDSDRVHDCEVELRMIGERNCPFCAKLVNGNGGLITEEDACVHGAECPAVTRLRNSIANFNREFLEDHGLLDCEIAACDFPDRRPLETLNDADPPRHY
jgi:hypothetical protein